MHNDIRNVMQLLQSAGQYPNPIAQAPALSTSQPGGSVCSLPALNRFNEKPITMALAKVRTAFIFGV